MIRSSAALPVVFGERPPVRRLGQQQVAGRERRSGPRWVEQLEYLVE